MQEANQKQRKQRSDTGPRITDRDRRALQWIGQQYAIRLDHFSILLFRLAPPGTRASKETGRITDKRSMEIIGRWEQLGLIEKAWILHGQPPWLWLSTAGLHLIANQDQTELRPYKPNAAKLEHLYYTNLVRLFVEARRLDCIWTSERQIAAGTRIERGTRQPHRPDAIIATRNSQGEYITIAIEIELTTKTRARLNKILYELATTPSYHTIWYFSHGRAQKLVETAINSMQDAYKNKFAVYNLDSIEQGGTHAAKA